MFAHEHYMTPDNFPFGDAIKEWNDMNKVKYEVDD
jgi:hypothetical protein